MTRVVRVNIPPRSVSVTVDGQPVVGPVTIITDGDSDTQVLDDLLDVLGATDAPDGSILVKQPDDSWQPEDLIALIESVASGNSYLHTQLSALDEWTVVHNLGYPPAGILTFDSVDDIIEWREIDYTIPNTTVVLRAPGRPVSGKAYLS